ncbi:hypothetical protein [Thermomonospora amylolytica]|uniref:hypothetical protein n=1 Tax=Thermomonospora amylolytica TaxID=1411117 RepID=UPI00130056A5|nr:hypothetical protein [Thermomonospora amylolytica]
MRGTLLAAAVSVTALSPAAPAEARAARPKPTSYGTVEIRWGEFYTTPNGTRIGWGPLGSLRILDPTRKGDDYCVWSARHGTRRTRPYLEVEQAGRIPVPTRNAVVLLQDRKTRIGLMIRHRKLTRVRVFLPRADFTHPRTLRHFTPGEDAYYQSTPTCALVRTGTFAGSA